MRGAAIELRNALRRWRARPAVPVTAVLTLTFGIGITTAIFSVVDGVLLRPLPWRDADRLAVAWVVRPEWRGNPVLAAIADRGVLSWPNFRDLQSQNGTLESVGIWVSARPIVDTGGCAEQVPAMAVSSTFLETLQVRPFAGRNFAPHEDDDPGDAVIVSYEAWQRRFGGDARILGRGISVDEAQRVIVGVLPPRFRFDGDPPEILLPVGEADKRSRRRGSHNYNVLVRLKAGVTFEQAHAVTEPILREGQPPSVRTSRLVPLAVEQAGETRRPLFTLLAASGVLLLVAYANVAGLLLADVRSRRVELAIRAALGASTPRLVRHLLVEATALGVGAAAAGALVARWLTPALVALAPETLPRLETVAIDLRVLGFALLLGVLTTAISGAGAAIGLLADDPARGLAEAGRGGSRRRGVQDVIVVCEIALALVLLAGASLFAETVRRLGAEPVGFDPASLVVLTVHAPRSMIATAEPAASAARAEALARRLAAVPGVVSAAGTAAAAFTGNRGSNSLHIEGKQLDPAPLARRQIVTGDFFETMRIPVLRGRVFDATDLPEAKLAVVSEDFERRYLDGDALGKRFRLGKGPDMMEIIGVVPNTKHVDLSDEAEPTFFALSRQVPTWPITQYVVRSAVDPESLMPALRAAARTDDPRLLVSATVTMQALIDRTMSEERFRALLTAIFGATALLLCAIGVYGLLAREVTDRRREMGLRMALGARPAAVLHLIVRQGLGLVAAGLLLGTPAALAAAELSRSLLFGIAPVAPAVYAIVAGTLLVAGMVATLVPARRASRVDPSVLLRSEA